MIAWHREVKATALGLKTREFFSPAHHGSKQKEKARRKAGPPSFKRTICSMVEVQAALASAWSSAVASYSPVELPESSAPHSPFPSPHPAD